MLAKAVLQYINILNQYIVHIKCTQCYMSVLYTLITIICTCYFIKEDNNSKVTLNTYSSKLILIVNFILYPSLKFSPNVIKYANWLTLLLTLLYFPLLKVQRDNKWPKASYNKKIHVYFTNLILSLVVELCYMKYEIMLICFW